MPETPNAPATRRSHRARDSGVFVPTSIWAAVFSPGLPVIAFITIELVTTVLDVPGSRAGLMKWIVVAGAVAVSAAYYLYRSRRNARTPQADAALRRLAQARGMRAVPLGSVPAHLKQALGVVGRGTVRDGLVSTHAPDVRIGTVERGSASGDRGYVQDWGFLAIRLGTALPNILLESRSGRTLFDAANPLAAPRGDQELSLEGDFDDHFRLVCPAGYERDALYIFTPDLMALLIDEAHDFSVQLIDDVIVFSSPSAFDLGDAALTERLFRIVDVVGAKALRQVARYSDDRSTVDGTVAEPGRRLVRRVPRWPVLALWYSLNAALGIAIAVAVLVAVLGPDPSLWAGEDSLFD
jgi:hypothetical protein